MDGFGNKRISRNVNTHNHEARKAKLADMIEEMKKEIVADKEKLK